MVASEAFVVATKEVLGNNGELREVIGGDGSYELQETAAAYKGIFGDENAALRGSNEYWFGNIH